ncbi:hypothetical protein Tco_0736395, partial [Tanacetum coccineum]
VFHSKTKHIEIRHHFIRDSSEKRLIQVIKIYTDHNVADLLTKAFDINDWNGLEMLRMKLGLKLETQKVNAARHYLCYQAKVNAARLLTTARLPLELQLLRFWSTAKIKIVNNERQIRAKVNGKTIVISESSVRRDLQFNDEDGIACLTNTEIFENLQLMGYENLSDRLTFYKSYFSHQWKYLIHTILQCLSSKSTAWNEFGTNIASAVICLAKNQKFNFSKLIFDGMLRNLDPNSKKFLMYPRFLQLFLNNQIENLTPTFNDEYDTPSHTKKVFANMRRQGKDFLGTMTPLFATMLIQPQAYVGEGSGQPTKPQHTPTTASPSNIEKTQKCRKTKRPTEISQSSGPTTLVVDETVHEEREDSMEKAATTAISLDVEKGSGINTPRSGEDILKIMELMEIYTKLSDTVLALENVKTAQDLEITSLKKRVKKLEKKKKARTPQLKRRLFKVKIESSADKSLGDQEDASKQGRNIAESDQDEEIPFVQEDAETQGSAEPSTPPTTTTAIEDEDLTIAQTLMKMRSEKSKEKAKERGSKEKSSEPATRPTRGVTILEPSESRTRRAVPPSQHDPKDKGNAKMIKPDKSLKKKDQIKFDEELAKRLAEELEAGLEEEERVAIQREEVANLISWDNTQAMMEADYELAQRLQAKE